MCFVQNVRRFFTKNAQITVGACFARPKKYLPCQRTTEGRPYNKMASIIKAGKVYPCKLFKQQKDKVDTEKQENN